MAHRWGQKRLLERLMVLLLDPKVKMRTRKLRSEHGTTDYNRDPQTREVRDMLITIDPRNAAVVTIVIHELLHLFMAIEYQVDRNFGEMLEEGIVKGLTEELQSYIHDAKRGKLLQKWVIAVNAKLNLPTKGA